MKSNNSIVLLRSRSDTPKYYFDFTVDNPYEHLGLEYLEAALQDLGYKVRIFDMMATEIKYEQVMQQVKNICPILIGFTLDSHSVVQSMKMARQIREEVKNIHITVGGHLATCAAEELLMDFDFLDSAVMGYGEQTIIEMAKNISKGLHLTDVTGLCFRDNNRIVRNSPREISVDIDCIPFPSRSILKFLAGKKRLLSTRIITSRGCTSNCSFCTTPAFIASQNCLKWIARSPENVVNEVSELVERFQTRVVIFSDDNFIEPTKIGRNRAKKIATLLIEQPFNINFWILSRADSFQEQDDAFVTLLKRAGLYGVTLGLESGSNSQLKVYNKQTNASRNEATIRLLKRNNILVECGFIMFHPYVTFDELRANAEFLYSNTESSIFRYFVDQLELYPGAGIIQNLRQRDLLTNDYRYSSVYGYDFSDPRVGELVSILQEISKVLQPVDAIIWDFKRLSQIIGLLIDEYQHITAMSELLERLLQLKTSVDRVENNVVSINYQKFLEYVEVASGVPIMRDYTRIKNDHREQLIQKVRELSKPLGELERCYDELTRLKNADLLEWLFKSRTAEILNFYSGK